MQQYQHLQFATNEANEHQISLLRTTMLSRNNPKTEINCLHSMQCTHVLNTVQLYYHAQLDNHAQFDNHAQLDDLPPIKIKYTRTVPLRQQLPWYG